MIGTRLITVLKRARKAGSTLQDLAELSGFDVDDVAAALGERSGGAGAADANGVRDATALAPAVQRAGALQRDADTRAAHASARAKPTFESERGALRGDGAGAPRPVDPSTMRYAVKPRRRNTDAPIKAFHGPRIETRFEHARAIAAPAVERLRPLTPDRLMFGRRFAHARWPLNEIAWLFDCDAEVLAAALETKAAAA